MASDERNKRLRASTSGDTCVTCSRDVEETGIECNWCYRWEHYDCAGLTEGEYSMLSNSSSKIMFFCTWCYKKVPFALKIEKEAQSNKEMFEANFTTITTKLSELHSNVAAVVTNLELKLGEHHKNFTNTLANHPIQMSTNPALTTIPEESVAHIAMTLAAEQKEKEKRGLNLIIHNVEESNAVDGATRRKDDISKCSDIFQTYLGVSATINKAFRLGKKSSKARLLKISLSDIQHKSTILKNKLKLRSSSNPSHIRKIFITPNLTPSEQKQSKELCQKLADMNKNENRYTIKNRKIVQRAR